MSSLIRTDDHLTVVFADGNTATIYTSNPSYSSVVEAARNKNWDEVRELMVPSKRIERKLQTMDSTTPGRVRIDNGVVYLDDEPVHNTLTDRMIQMCDDGFDIEPMKRFLENLNENPSYRAVNELYGFLEKSELPITEAGHFIAYKRIRNDYKDLHTGKMDNSIGATVSMPRNKVNEDKNQTCSTGLHFCSREYLSSYGGGSQNKTVVVTINPRDVVSIPTDYNDSKGRCCKYVVTSELTHGAERKLEGSYVPPEPTPEPTPEPKIAKEDIKTSPLANSSGSVPVTDSLNKIGQIDLSTGIVMRVFEDAKHAEESTGILASNIRRVAKGGRKSTGGFGWMFVSNDAAKPVVIAQSLKASILDDSVLEPDEEWEGDDYFDNIG